MDLKLRLFQMGQSVLSLDCKSIKKCVELDGIPTLVGRSIELNCHKYAGCGLVKGFPNCRCKDGYFGDGVYRCERKSKY